jgi:hypothetical protein
MTDGGRRMGEASRGPPVKSSGRILQLDKKSASRLLGKTGISSSPPEPSGWYADTGMRVSADVASAQVKCFKDFGENLLERQGIVDYNLLKELSAPFSVAKLCCANRLGRCTRLG